MRNGKPATLDYAPAHRGAKWRARLRRLQRLLPIFVLLGFLLWMATLFPTRVRAYLAMRKCLSHTAPSTQVAFEGNSVSGRSLTQNADYYHAYKAPQPTRDNPEALYIPACWRDLCEALDGSYAYELAPVFLHELQTRGGLRRLVVLEYGGAEAGLGFAHASRHYGAQVSVFTTGTLFTLPRRLGRKTVVSEVCDLPPRPAVGYSRVLCGQADPTNAARFTVELTERGRPAVIEGILQEDGESVKLVVHYAMSSPSTAPATKE